MSTIDSLKDEIYTIAIIGRPNVGKSTLFNRLMGQQLALVDRTPGLTRDRREGITELFGMHIRLVDTAGFEQSKNIDEITLQTRSLNKAMVADMVKQTRNALIYADLALFLLDTREGITKKDIALQQWLRDVDKSEKQSNPFPFPEEEIEPEIQQHESSRKTVDKFNREQIEFEQKTQGSTEREPLVPGKIPGIEYIKVRQSKGQKRQDEYS